MILFGIDIDARTIAAECFHARAHVRDAHASTARRRSIRIAGILDDDLEQAVAASRRYANLAAFQQMRNAVMYRILDERLQHERRHGDLAHLIRHVETRAQPVAEANSFDGEKRLDERDLFFERNRLLARERQALAEELRHEKAHLTRGGGILTDERRDGIQAVEQEVRIELRTQRFELGFARVHLQLERAALGGA